MNPTTRSDGWAQTRVLDNRAEGWETTRVLDTAAVTQLLATEEDYLAEGPRPDVGRQTASGIHELFVSCEPALALRQQFEHLRPDFMAVHDVGTSSSRKLLTGIAAASGRSVCQLVVRRQGFGNALCTLSFVELPTPDGRSLRMYSTDAECDAALKPAMVRVLLAFSRLGVVMVGDQAVSSLPAALKPLDEAMLAKPWPNRQMLLLPLGQANAVASQGMELGRGSGVQVRTTPQVARPADAWNFINAAWARLNAEAEPPRRPAASVAAASAAARRASAGSAPGTPAPYAAGGTRPAGAGAAPGTGASVASGAAPGTGASVASGANPGIPAGAAPPTGAGAAPGTGAADVRASGSPAPSSRAADIRDALAATEMRAMPPVPTGTKPELPAGSLEKYIQHLSEMAGMVSCCIFDTTTGRTVLHAGANPGADDLSGHGSALLHAMAATSKSLGFGHATPEAAITLGSHHLLLRAVPKHPGYALHAVLDKSHANLTLARLQVLRMDSLLDTAPPAYAERRKRPREAQPQ